MKENRKNFSFVLRVLCLIVSAAITAQFIVPKVYAWFLNKNDRDLTITGSVRRTYFERGSGTDSDPYVIARPLQLYYLAWLQDMGVFNQDLDNDGTLDAFYFELGCMNGQNPYENMEIDMSGMTLPPIGTTTYPFVSSFNGKGRTISNLTVSNNKGALTDMPTNSTPDTATTNAPILGLFGVVGGYTSTTGYSPPEKSVYNVILEDITIDNTSPAGNQALAGLAAGYVNGVMENVTVTGTSTINNTPGITAMSFGNDTRTTLSDYALAGYCTEAYRDLLKREDVKVYDPTVEISDLSTYGEIGQGSAWGNSIDIHDMYNKLKSKYDSLAGQTSINYTSSKTITHNTDGTTNEVGGGTSSYQVTAGTFPVRMTAKNSGDVDSYAFIQRNDTDDFMYLYGNTLINTVPVTTTEIWKYESFYIKDHDTDNYLAVISDAAANAKTAETAGKWVFEQDTATGKYAIFTIDSNTKKYLTANNGSLGISTTAFSGWEVNAAKTSISVNDHYLCWNNTDSEWELCSPPKNYICDTAENHYLSVQMNNGTPAIVDETDIDDATSWELDNGMIYIVINGINHYLAYDNNTDQLYVSDSEYSIWYANTDGQKGKIYVKLDDQHGRALYYDEDIGNWIVTDYTIGVDGTDWGGSIDIKSLNMRLYHLLNKNTTNVNTEAIIRNRTVLSRNYRYYIDDDNIITSFGGDANSTMKYNPSENNVTYRLTGEGNSIKNSNSNSLYEIISIPGSVIPLNVEEQKDEITGIYSYPTEVLNTGYIVGGGLDSSNTVRSASVERSKISNAYSSGTWKIYTNSQVDYSSSGFAYINDNNNNLKKYAKARKALDEILPNSVSGKIHGLHFANAAVDVNNKVSIDRAIITDKNGSHTYTGGYELLQSCIDFNLKENGFINFFAGSYTASSANPDSFFALSFVTRNSNNTITGATQIKEVWSNTNENTKDEYPYVYKYGNNSFSTGSDNVSYTVGSKLFDMQYLTNDPNGYYNSLFYFEIPVNPGEYAMGCVGGKVTGGAYLLYLDISANATIEGDAKIKSEGTAITATSSQSTGEVQISETQSRSENIETPPTYFPLAMNASGTNVLDSNTGYVVSGANYPDNDPPGDIRVSKYDRDTYIGNSLTSCSLDNRKILTIGANGQQILTQYGIDRFYKYQTAKSQLQETLDAGNGKIYGLHFMNAEISKDHLVTLPSATINGQTYTNYTVPEDCIDFTLRSQGYINFFAGSYFSGSDVQCFFSLHQIFRNEQNEITEIKEIKEIYKNTDGTYTYRYNGENAPSSGTKVFDTAWLTDPSNIIADRVYYFEIPVNAGEYALGSVAGKNGAYLLYLDISTHQGDSIITREKMEIITTTYLLPTGVRFSDDEYKAYIIPITQTGNIEIVSEDQTVTSDPALSDTSTSETRLVETVTIKDYAGTLVVQRITDGNNVTYYRGTDTEHLNASTAQICSRYFADTASDTILEYYYYPEAENTVLNTASPAYTIEDEIIITEYDVTASAASATLTATVTAFDSDKSYLKFQNRNNLVAGDTVTIPARSP